MPVRYIIALKGGSPLAPPLFTLGFRYIHWKRKVKGIGRSRKGIGRSREEEDQGTSENSVLAREREGGNEYEKIKNARFTLSSVRGEKCSTELEGLRKLMVINSGRRVE